MRTDRRSLQRYVHVARPVGQLTVVVALVLGLVACESVERAEEIVGHEDASTIGIQPSSIDVSDLEGQTVSGTIVVSIEAAGWFREVHVYLDGDHTVTLEEPPFEQEIDTTELSDEEHTLGYQAVTPNGLVGSAKAGGAGGPASSTRAWRAAALEGAPTLTPEPNPVAPIEPYPDPQTVIEIVGEDWYVNGMIVNPGSRAEGLLMNSRMVQATFEDENSATVHEWAYPNGIPYDPQRQTDEFVAMVPTYAGKGLNAVTVSLQGGRPRSSGDPYGSSQPWINTAFDDDGSLKPAYMERMAQVIEALDQHGMVAILSYFYFGQDDQFPNEAAISNAVENATQWVVDKGYTNVVIELANEVGHRQWSHDIFSDPDRAHELISTARSVAPNLLYGCSLGGGHIPPDSLIAAADFHLPHGNNQSASRVAQMVVDIRSSPSYGGEPIVFNEDSTTIANLYAAVEAGAGWGYYDQGANDYRTGFQSPPTNWTINTPEKQAFFEAVQEVTTPVQEPVDPPEPQSVELTLESGEGGSIVAVPEGPYVVGDAVVFTAVAADGYEHESWGEACGEAPVGEACGLDLIDDVVVSATFEELPGEIVGPTRSAYVAAAKDLGAVLVLNQERSGGRWLDQSGNELHGTEINGPTWHEEGGPGPSVPGYYAFDSTYLEYIVVGDDPVLRFTDAMTLVWFERGEVPYFAHATRISKGDRSYHIRRDAPADGIRYTLRNNDAGNEANVFAESIDRTSWQMYMARYDGSRQTLWRIDGHGRAEVLASLSYSGDIETNTDPFAIAAQHDRTDWRRWWSGDLAGLLAFPAALSTAQFEQLHAAAHQELGASSPPDPGDDAFAAQTGVVHQPYLSWRAVATDYGTRNPYDVEATATFTPRDGGEGYRVPLFYAGGNTFEFRFTGPRVGTYDIATSSLHSVALDGLTGTIVIESNSDPGHKGFMTTVANADCTGSFAYLHGDDG